MKTFKEWLENWGHAPLGPSNGIKMQGTTDLMTSRSVDGRTNYVGVRVKNDGDIEVVRTTEGGSNPIYNEPSRFLAQGTPEEVMQQLSQDKSANAEFPGLADKVHQFIQSTMRMHGPFKGQHG